jgi:hypothetical protein
MLQRRTARPRATRESIYRIALLWALSLSSAIPSDGLLYFKKCRIQLARLCWIHPARSIEIILVTPDCFGQQIGQESPAHKNRCRFFEALDLS